MGVLDEAIRQHLELKRSHGASEEELSRQEAEALGPARRDPASSDDQGGSDEEDARAHGSEADREQGAVRDRADEEPPRPTARSAADEEEADEVPVDEALEPSTGAAPGASTGDDGDSVRVFDVEELGPPDETAAGARLSDAPAGDLAFVDADVVDEDVIDEEELDAEELAEEELAEELAGEDDLADEPGVADEPALAGDPRSVDRTEADTSEYDAGDELVDVEVEAEEDLLSEDELLEEEERLRGEVLLEDEEEDELLEEEGELLDEDELVEDESLAAESLEEEPPADETLVQAPGAADDPPAAGSSTASEEESADAAPAEGDADEDVLEETPEFLQETPEDERLWFEQKPPRDFDLDR